MKLALFIPAFLSLLLLSPEPQRPADQTPTDPPTFLIYKYQHPVGKEIDTCNDTGRRCHSHFQLDFTGSSIALDSEIVTDPFFRPIVLTAKGQNSTRSFVDLTVRVDEGRGTVVENGVTRQIDIPPFFFTLKQDVPV